MSDDSDDSSEAIAELIGELIEPLFELVCWLGATLPAFIFWPLVFALCGLGLSFCTGWL